MVMGCVWARSLCSEGALPWQCKCMHGAFFKSLHRSVNACQRIYSSARVVDQSGKAAAVLFAWGTALMYKLGAAALHQCAGAFVCTLSAAFGSWSSLTV